MRIALVMLVGLATVAAPAVAGVPVEPTPLTLTDKFPTVKRATTIVTNGTPDKITLTYSPGSGISKTETIDVKSMKLVLWRPQRAGVVSVAAPGHADKNVSVRFDGVPLSGLLIMLLAGLFLFGGAIFSLKSLLRG